MKNSLFALLGTAVLLFVGTGGAQAASEITGLPPGSPTIEVIRQRGRLIVGNTFKFRSFNFRNPETGEYEGYMADYARALAKKMLGDEKKVEFRYAGGKELYSNVRFVVRGDVDVEIECIGENAGFKTMVSFSDEIFVSAAGLVVRRDSPIRSIDDIKKGTRVVHGMSDGGINLIMAKHPDASYFIVEDDYDAFDAVRSGRADLYTQQLPILYNFAAVDPGLVVVGRYTADKPYGIVCPKNDRVFLDYVNAFIREMKAGGEQQRLYDKWLAPHDDGPRP